MSPGPAPRPRTAWWNDLRVRGMLWQIVAVGAVVAVGAYLVGNTIENLNARKISSGFGFLEREAGFAIGESLVRFGPQDSYLRALWVGVLNTLQVSFLGIVLCTILGTLVGIARLSSNWLVARLATVYVEGVRNVPLLLQLFFWYALIYGLPPPRQALHPIDAIYLSNRGLRVGVPVWETGHALALFGLGLAVAAILVLRRWGRRRHERTGQPFPIVGVGAALVVLLPVAGWLAGGAPTAMDMPELAGFNFKGGANLTPEFAALLIGVTTYTAAFVAEIVRGGILAVPPGQTEAALALGLSRRLVLRLVLLPQALRVIVPPLTSQYLNLTKNSSLAVAIGYPDLVSVANTTMNQTGQAVEGVALIMAVYLTISLAISAFMNWYNRRIALKGGRG